MTVYATGTISLVNGSKTIGGIGTGWQAALIVGGVIHVQAENGNALPFDTVVSNTEITAAIEWTGATGTYAYALVRDTQDGRQQIASAVALSEYIQRLNANGLAAVAGVTPQADTLLLFTGASSATTISRTDLMQGVAFDEAVDTVAGLATYDGEEAGFSVLVVTAGGGRSAIYIKKSAAAGDWTAPVFVTGATGEAGPFTVITFEPVETLTPGSLATMTTTPTGPGAVSIRFSLPAGVPGDIEGPDGGVQDGDPVVFDGPSGKKIKKGSSGGKNDALFALEIADLKGVRLGMVGGVADAFDDEAGIGVKTNAVYNSANDWYSPAVVTTAITLNSYADEGPAFGTTYFNLSAIINNGRVIDSIGAHSNSPRTIALKIARQNSYTSFDILMSMTVSHPGGGWVDFPLPEPFTIPASGTFNLASYVDSGNPSRTAANVARSTASGNASGSGVAAIDGTSGGVVHPLRYSYITGGRQDMVLSSIDYAASVQPSSGRVSIQVSGSETISPNIDLFADMSRDGGVSWSVGVLSLVSTLSGIRVFEANDLDLTTLYPGTAVRWRVRTANSKNIPVSGVVAQWRG